MNLSLHQTGTTPLIWGVYPVSQSEALGDTSPRSCPLNRPLEVTKRAAHGVADEVMDMISSLSGENEDSQRVRLLLKVHDKVLVGSPYSILAAEFANSFEAPTKERNSFLIAALADDATTGILNPEQEKLLIHLRVIKQLIAVFPRPSRDEKEAAAHLAVSFLSAAGGSFPYAQQFVVDALQEEIDILGSLLPELALLAGVSPTSDRPQSLARFARAHLGGFSGREPWTLSRASRLGFTFSDLQVPAMRMEGASRCLLEYWGATRIFKEDEHGQQTGLNFTLPAALSFQWTRADLILEGDDPKETLAGPLYVELWQSHFLVADNSGVLVIPNTGSARFRGVYPLLPAYRHLNDHDLEDTEGISALSADPALLEKRGFRELPRLIAQELQGTDAGVVDIVDSLVSKLEGVFMNFHCWCCDLQYSSAVRQNAEGNLEMVGLNLSPGFPAWVDSIANLSASPGTKVFLSIAPPYSPITIRSPFSSGTAEPRLLVDESILRQLNDLVAWRFDPAEAGVLDQGPLRSLLETGLKYSAWIHIEMERE